MKPCVVIPCFNHVETLAGVALAAARHCDVLVVDDGSTIPLPELPGIEVLILERNSGKGAALKAGLAWASERGFSHAITMDADGQHFADDVPVFMKACAENPEALIVGVRDFEAAGAPKGRRRSNAISAFWFRVASGVRLPDTQCGFRAYPLALMSRMKIRSGRYAFELETMIRAAWLEVPIVSVPARCIYRPEQLKHSHFRPVMDFIHIGLINAALIIQSWTIPRTLRANWCVGKRNSVVTTIKELFSDHAHDPLKMAMAVALGFFFGIAPIWGLQMIAAATIAHWLRLNKAITLLASNISIPPVMPFIFYGALVLGHWMFTGEFLDLRAQEVTRQVVMGYLGQWVVGSFALAAIVSGTGFVATYGIAQMVRRS